MIDVTDRPGQSNGTVASGPNLEDFIRACGVRFERGLPPLLDALFDRLDDALYDLADKAGNDRLYARYFDAMRLFRRQGRNVKAIFLRQLRRSGELTASGLVGSDSGALDSQQTGGFTLVEEAELEESLAIGNLVSKAENRYQRQLHDLGRYLGQLLGRRDLAPRSNPLGPVAICDAFGAALRQVQDLDLAIKLVIYKLFDKQVMDQLGGIYDECLTLAGTQGLTLTLDERRATPRPVPLAAPVSPVASDPARRGAAGFSAHAAGGVPFTQLRTLLGHWRGSSSASGGDGGPKVLVETSELMTILSQLQDASRYQQVGQIAPREVRARLDSAVAASPSRSGGSRRSLGDLDEDTLELVLLLFEALAQANDLPDPIKAQIGRLQIPMVKVAVLDRTFFDRPDHPARRLLNRIADAAVGWSDDEPRTADSLYGRIEHIVDRVIGEFDRDLGLFDQLDAELAAFCQREVGRVRMREASVCSVAAGKDRIASARRKAQRAIAERLGRAPWVPEVVEALLNEGWQEVLYAAHLSGGETGKEWCAAVEVVDRLLWSVQPKVENDERRSLLRGVPELLRALRAGLTAVGCDQRLLAGWFKELQALHMAALRGAVAADARQGALAVPAGTAASRRPSATQGRGDHYPGSESTAQMSRLVPGCWVELVRDDARRVRIKLAWVSGDGDRFVFVNRQGGEGPELARGDLSTLLEYGLAKILRAEDDPPLMDRALATLVHSLNG